MAQKQTENATQDEKRTVRGAGRTDIPAANDAIRYRIKPTLAQYRQICQGIGNARYYWNLIIDIALITHEMHKTATQTYHAPSRSNQPRQNA